MNRLPRTTENPFMSYPRDDAREHLPGTLVEDSEAGVVLAGEGAPLQPGEVVDRFQVVEWLGEGATATVYRVRHRQLGSDYALKVLRGLAQGTARERLLQEGRLQSRLDHPHIVRVHDVLAVGPSLALVMDYVDGSSLAEALQRDAIDRDQAEQLFGQILDAVDAAHRAGITHRDLKPANVILTQRGDDLVARVTDFGIARQRDLHGGMHTRTGALVGTLEYMSPEQLRGDDDVDSRADLFALGVILYELCLGQRPFAQTHLVRLVTAIEEANYRPIEELDPELPDRLRLAIQACLIADRERRVPDCATLRAILQGATWELPEATESVAITGSPVPPAASSPRRATHLALGSLFLLLLLAGGVAERHLRLQESTKTSADLLEKTVLEREAWRHLRDDPSAALALFRAADALSAPLLAELQSLGAAAHHRPFDDQVARVAYSPDGRLQAAGTLGGEVVVWETATGAEVTRFSSGVKERLWGLEFGPDGSSLVVLPLAADDAPGRSDPARVFDASTGQLLHSLSHGGRTAAVALSADGLLGATQGYDHRVVLWNLETGAPVATFGEDSRDQQVNCLAFSPTEELLALGIFQAGGGAHVALHRPDIRGSWEATELPIPADLLGQGECQIAFTAHGQDLIMAAGNGLLRWDAASSELKRSVPTTTWRTLAIDPAGATLVHSNRQGHLRLRRVDDLSLIATLRAPEGELWRAAYTTSGAVVAGGTDGVVRLFHGATGDLFLELRGNRSWILGLAASATPQGAALATAGRDGVLRTWSLGTTPQATHDAAGLDISHYHWSDDGQALSLGTRDFQVHADVIHSFNAPIQHLHRADQGDLAVVLRSGDIFVYRGDELLRRRRVELADRAWLSPDGQELLVVRSHSLLLERDGGRETFLELRFRDRIRQVLPHWDGRRALVLDERDLLTLVDLDSGERQALEMGHQESASLALSPDGDHAAVGFWSGGAELWNLATGARIADLAGHEDSVTTLRFSPDGARLVTGSHDGAIRLWDGHTGQALQTFTAHRKAAVALHFLRDDVLVSAGQDRLICLWTLPAATAARAPLGHPRACEKLGGLPRDLRVQDGPQGPLAAVLDEEFRRWSVSLDSLDEEADLLTRSGRQTNIRVCQNTLETVAVLPYPDPATLWAPDDHCTP